MKAHSQELISRLGQRLLQSFQQLRWLGRATLWQHLVFLGVDAAELTQARWVASNDRQVVAIHNAIVRIFVSRNRDNAPLLGHPYTTRVIKVDKHTKERTRGLAQLSVLALPIEMPLHLSSPTWVLSKVWAKCQAPEGQERKEAQLHQCNEDISSNTHTKRCPNVTWNNMKEVVWNHVSLSMTPQTHTLAFMYAGLQPAYHRSPSQEPYPISKWHQSLIDSTT